MSIAGSVAASATAEVAELRTRLAEAEAALDAIRSGASDAFVGETGGVFHRTGSEKPYVTFFGAMNEGGATLDGSGAILHGNPRFAAMIGRSIDALRGTSFLSCVAPESRSRVAELMANEATAACEVSLDGPSGMLPVRLSIKTVDTDRQRFRCVVATDLSEHAKVEAELRDAIARQREADIQLRQSEHDLRSMVANLQAMVEAERKHVAREVHDELGQILTALRMETSLLQRELQGQPAPQARVNEMLLQIEGMFKTVRSIAGSLRPSTLDLGLVPAIEWLAEDFEKRWKIDCVLDIDPREIQASDAYATAVFRIIQESLTNVARHAQASSVSISLRHAQDRLQLEIHDNGRGFGHDKEPTSGFGVIGMRERVKELGGVLNVRSAAGKGTDIVIDLPMATVAM